MEPQPIFYLDRSFCVHNFRIKAEANRVNVIL